jgi:sulfoxide reductase heme-binding subunit YedZ
LAILHFFWMRAGKNDFAEVAVYAAIIATLLDWRLTQCLKKKRFAVTLALILAARARLGRGLP